MNKHAVIAGISVVLLLIILPLVSFYYLRQGLSFRVNSLEALEQNEMEAELTKKLPAVFPLKKGLVNVLLIEKDFDNHQITDLYSNFHGNKYFFLHTFHEEAESELYPVLGDSHIRSRLSKKQKALFGAQNIILMDTLRQVRRTYASRQSDFDEFVRHLTVLLPMERSRKIVLER